MKRTMVTVLFAVACGASAPVTKPLPLATPGSAETLASRKDVLCKRSDLVQLGPELLSGSTSTADRGVVRAVSVRGIDDHDVDVMHELLAGVKVGSPFDVEATRDAARRVWRTGKYDDVAIETARAGDAIDIVIRVVPRRAIANVFVSGASESEDAASMLHLAPGALYDPVALVSARRAFVESEAKRGYLDANISVSSAFASPDHRTIDVCVRSNRGALVALDGVEIRGSSHNADLEALFAREDSHNVRGNPVDRDMLERDELVMAAWLYDRGHLAHTIEKKVDRIGDAIHVRFDVTDGQVFHYGKLDVKGDLAVAKGEILKLIVLKRGDVFNRGEVVQKLDAIRSMLKALGHDHAEVEPLTNLDTAAGTVDITLSIDDPAARPAAPTAGTPRFSIVEVAPGHGRAVKSGDTVNITYKGMLTDGKVFDTNVGHAPFQFEIGKGRVIAGFDRGVTGMKVGGKRKVTIPPDLGYGARGAPPTIPGNSTLVFEIELVSIQ